MLDLQAFRPTGTGRVYRMSVVRVVLHPWITGLRGRAAGSTGEAGPVERELELVGSRYAMWLRIVISVSVGVLGVAAAQPPDLPVVTTVFVVAASGWTVVGVFRPPGSRSLCWSLAVDGPLVVLVGLSQLGSGPQQASSWVFAVVAITSVTCHYEWPRQPVVGWTVAALGIGAYAVGNVLAGPDDGVAGLCLRLVVQSVLTRISFQLIRACARAADAAAAWTAERHRQSVVAAARRAAEREYLAMLHDTASTTFLMVSLGSSDDLAWLEERARQDLEVLGSVPGMAVRQVDLAAAFAPLAEYPGLRVELTVPSPLVMPARPAFAILLGVREGLRNVRLHAGTTRALLRVDRNDADQVVVELRDHGRGFDPEHVPAHRRGISGSIVERMAIAGGRAELGARPGAGTTVRWTWPDG